ncbi:hypothetical protein QFW80_04550 [Luteimonas sp. M1R5S18]|uniref:Uncharacterized protein n=1 Tax=Luteimonas rhizosphaericola TaxID=3042024 RepID=A0ABT6JGH3_9GAMM|nr:hypothetical protein [Luteimonas rhizosphaericola]MDH5829788.1 hypothetical protein [Luteimonas rhizosphaericola]
MSNVIAFPRTRPLAAHELPAHWSPSLRITYGNLTDAGYLSHAEALDHCERLAQTDDDVWAQARAAIAGLPRV